MTTEQFAEYLLDVVLTKHRLARAIKYNKTQGHHIPEEDISEILYRRSQGESLSSIADSMKWARSTVHLVCQRAVLSNGQQITESDV